MHVIGIHVVNRRRRAKRPVGENRRPHELGCRDSLDANQITAVAIARKQYGRSPRIDGELARAPRHATRVDVLPGLIDQRRTGIRSTVSLRVAAVDNAAAARPTPSARAGAAIDASTAASIAPGIHASSTGSTAAADTGSTAAAGTGSTAAADTASTAAADTASALTAAAAHTRAAAAR